MGGLAGAGWEALALAGMMLTEHGVIEEDPCEPRSESMHRGSLIRTKEPRIYNGGRRGSSTNGAGKTEQPHAKERNRTPI